VWPHSIEALEAALDARGRCGVEPLLVGDPAKIRTLLGELGVADPPRIVAARSDVEAASAAVALVRAGEADILMKGHLHSDDFLRPILRKETGLRTDRLMSHVFACAVPHSIYHKTLYVTDAAFNIAPGLNEKRSIAQNAIDLVRLLGCERPKVAILAAVESVNPAMIATTDAAALSKMAERGQITGGIVDGPLAFDNAISLHSAQAKGITSPVAGDPDILLVPTIEAGNMMYKQFVYFCGAVAPGVILGATAPVLLMSRSEPVAARTAAIAISALIAGGKNGGAADGAGA
ncbi:MAG: bifunctional enoyl-CoA hydratase/phosphate acetyltransferase, partial [Vulcanimicrobiaceae bacterium]